MKFEAGVGIVVAGVMAGSSLMANVRFTEERARRNGLKGTQLMNDSTGKSIEYLLSPGYNPDKQTLVLENGLGDPLECWDWIDHELRDKFNILRYHRAGYFRTESTLRPAKIIETLLAGLNIPGPIHMVSHSLGALVTANALLESGALRKRTESGTIIDGTDAALLGDDRASEVKSGRFRQATMQQILASITGMDRWTPGKTQRDVQYRPDIQQSFIASMSSPRAKITAQGEYFKEPLAGQEHLKTILSRIHVVAAGDNLVQQRALASKLEATFHSIEGSSHRSIIGSPFHARSVAELINEVTR